MAQTSIDLWFPELDHFIGRWRRSTVPAAAFGVAPHISLLFPWVTEAPLAHHLSRLKVALVGIEPFELTFTKLGRFPGVLWLAPEPHEVVRSLMHRVVQAFPEFPPYDGQFIDPKPHLTVAKGEETALLRVEREVTQVLPEIGKQRFFVDHVSIALENSDGQWSVAARVQFGTG